MGNTRHTQPSPPAHHHHPPPKVCIITWRVLFKVANKTTSYPDCGAKQLAARSLWKAVGCRKLTRSNRQSKRMWNYSRAKQLAVDSSCKATASRIVAQCHWVSISTDKQACVESCAKQLCMTVWWINRFSWLKCCFTSTETVGLFGTGAQDVHLDFPHSSRALSVEFS